MRTYYITWDAINFSLPCGGGACDHCRRRVSSSFNNIVSVYSAYTKHIHKCIYMCINYSVIAAAVTAARPHFRIWRYVACRRRRRRRRWVLLVVAIIKVGRLPGSLPQTRRTHAGTHASRHRRRVFPQERARERFRPPGVVCECVRTPR